MNSWIELAINRVDPGHGFLHAQLHHKDYQSRRDAAFMLCSLQMGGHGLKSGGIPAEKWYCPEDQEAIPVLIEALKDRQPYLSEPGPGFTFQTAALKVLTAFGAEAAPAVPALRQLLMDQNVLVRQEAARTLGAIGPKARAALPALLAALKDKEPAMRAAAAEGLRGIGPEAVPALQQLLVDQNVLVRQEAARTLGAIGPKARAAMPALLAALKDKEPAMRAAAAEGLGGIGPEAQVAVPLLLDGLKDKDPSLRASAATALGGIGAREAIPALKEALKDTDDKVKVASVGSLVRFGPTAKSVVPELIKLAKDPKIAWVAYQALQQIAPEEAAKIPVPGVPEYVYPQGTLNR